MSILYWTIGIIVGLYIMYRLKILALLGDLLMGIIEIFTDIDL